MVGYRELSVLQKILDNQVIVSDLGIYCPVSHKGEDCDKDDGQDQTNNSVQGAGATAL